jgi:thiol-disulfide isomerase/thioredoxin
MRYSSFFLFIFFLLQVQAILAQGNTLLIGQLNNMTKDYFVLRIDKTFLDNSVQHELANIGPEGKFGLSFQLEIPQLVTLRYDNKEVQIFMEPNDTLHLELDGMLFPYGIKIQGRAAANNQCLKTYREQFAEDTDPFHARLYGRDVYYYSIHEQLDQLMRSQTPAEFVNGLRREQMKKEEFLDGQQNLTAGFKHYMTAEYYYDRLYKQLAYGHVYRGKHGLDSSFFYFVDSLQYFDDLALGHQKYREFLTAWINYRCEGRPLADSTNHKYLQQYYFAKSDLTGLSRYVLMAQLLNTAFKKLEPEVVMPIYRDFLENNPYIELDKIAVDAYQQTQQFAPGSPAPNFSLQDIDGNYVSLRDFQGKVVYLDFWASWCRPCMKKLEEMKELEQNLANKNIVFLHINLDKSPEIWKNTVQTKKLPGLHLYNMTSAKVTEYYQVLSVPKFFLITKEGNFAFTPTTNDVQNLFKTLTKLSE